MGSGEGVEKRSTLLELRAPSLLLCWVFLNNNLVILCHKKGLLFTKFCKSFQESGVSWATILWLYAWERSLWGQWSMDRQTTWTVYEHGLVSNHITKITTDTLLWSMEQQTTWMINNHDGIISNITLKHHCTNINNIKLGWTVWAIFPKICWKMVV